MLVGTRTFFEVSGDCPQARRHPARLCFLSPYLTNEQLHCCSQSRKGPKIVFVTASLSRSAMFRDQRGCLLMTSDSSAGAAARPASLLAGSRCTWESSTSFESLTANPPRVLKHRGLGETRRADRPCHRRTGRARAREFRV